MGGGGGERVFPVHVKKQNSGVLKYRPKAESFG